MVIWVMVVLMIAFLLTTVLTSLGRPKADRANRRRVSGPAIGTFADGQKLTEGERLAASDDLLILRLTGLGDPVRSLIRRTMGISSTADEIALLLTAQPIVVDGRVVAVREIDDGRAAEMWAMLLHEARAMGLKADPPLVNQFMGESLGLAEEQLTEHLAQLARQNVTEDRFREAMGNLVIVSMAFDAVSGGTPDQDLRVRSLFERLAARMDVAMLTFSAADFLDQAPQPSGEAFEQEIQAMFEAGKTYRAGAPDNPNPMGFGYRLSDQVKVEYAHVSLAQVAGNVTVTDEEIQEYMAAHRQELANAVRASQAETQPAETQPAETQPAE
ncbi:MAG: hypothetical protein GX591_15470, partial [Planctomycetes bacterium]|nr:hypothetical protein [Planctomycetota bacterium]